MAALRAVPDRCGSVSGLWSWRVLQRPFGLARADRGHTVLVSSHLLTEVEHLVDDVVVINEGHLVTTGTIEDLTGSSAQVRTPSSAHLADVLAAAGATVQHAAADTLVVTGLGLDQIGDAAHTAGIAIHELSPHAGSLEDVFLELTTPTIQKGA